MNERSGDVPVLIPQTGKLTGARWALDRDEIVIGRSPECARQGKERTRECPGLSRAWDGVE